MYLFLGGKEQGDQDIFFLFHNRGLCGSLNALSSAQLQAKRDLLLRGGFRLSFKDDAPPACFLHIQRKQRVHSVPPMPRHLLLLCFPHRVFPSSAVPQSLRCVRVSGNGKIGLNVLNTKSSPRIYTNMTGTHEEILVNKVYPLRLCSISD